MACLDMTLINCHCIAGCIKSHFLHTFIVVKTSNKEPPPGEPRKYSVSVVCRDEGESSVHVYDHVKVLL